MQCEGVHGEIKRDPQSQHASLCRYNEKEDNRLILDFDIQYVNAWYIQSHIPLQFKDSYYSLILNDLFVTYTV